MLRPEAESPTPLKLNAALEGNQRPLLCKNPATVNLVLEVLDRAIAAQTDDTEKAKRLFEIAAKLEAEICQKPAADDIVILRCNLEQQTYGNTKISLLKLSALLRSNPSAGEQPFYAWTYAPIEGSEGDDATVQDAAKRWCTEQTAADEPVESTPDLVQRVQQRFYDFGFSIPTIDGHLTPETVQAIIDFQKANDLPPTGQLTKVTVQKIDATEAPTPWAAIAFDGYGNHVMVNGLTRRGTETEATSRFRRKSRNEYHVAILPYPRCLAIATTRYGTRRRSYTQAFTSAGNSQSEARDNAVAYCSQEKGGGTCQARDSICAAEGQGASGGGGEQRFDPKNPPANSFNPRFDPKNEPINSALPPGLSGESDKDQSPDLDKHDEPPSTTSDDKPGSPPPEPPSVGADNPTQGK